MTGIVDAPTPSRIEVWVAMADHFLDTETRHDIPLTALRCVDAGLMIADAKEIWCYEVSRAVGFNAWDKAGEWALWDREWLIERIDRLRRRWDNTPGTARWLRYRIRVHLCHRIWLAIGRCMGILLGVQDSVQRKQVTVDLASLARHYFDFCPDDYSALNEDAIARLRALYPEPFRSAMKPAIFSDESTSGHERVQQALARAPA
jgi:hypothetical protein